MIFILIALGICGIDLSIKYWIESRRTFSDKTELLKGNVVIEKSHNNGVCLNFMEKRPNYVLGITGIILGILICFFAILLPKKRKYFWKLAVSFMAGGASGNFFDRMHRGYVVDYLNFPKIKKMKQIDFNLSDLFLIAGSALAFIISLFTKESQ
ncbi:signal peptidase II [[Clostridium] polysaccharolyticum]|uniref:Lipoprotein signal peptidase n=1 Tax=[Clostridium] polysaccharolyticum TaxID=29364 RepID=A0A1I0CW29_9FIRM|nr:signal peptidase II [[Clostridium] polysaccharolyticum]SET23517.1 signal peptidase II [[Clostridium] polysaccharolyticum]